MNVKYITLLNNWFKNDPNPMKTMDLIKKKIDWQKKMIRIDPLLVFKTAQPEDYKLWLEDHKRLKKIYYFNRGMDKEKNFQAVWNIPEFVWNIDPDYWYEVTRGRQYTKHPEFLFIEPHAHSTIAIN